MFRAPLCPSSGVQGCNYCVWFSALKVLAGVLGRREACRVHCVEALFRLIRKTISSSVQPFTAEGGHNGARNMLSYWFISKS